MTFFIAYLRNVFIIFSMLILPRDALYMQGKRPKNTYIDAGRQLYCQSIAFMFADRVEIATHKTSTAPPF